LDYDRYVQTKVRHRGLDPIISVIIVIITRFQSEE
jgi:hypothetical protein